MGDNVNHPDHYTFGDIECIDAIHAALGDVGFVSYCEGNAIKYLWRHRFKGGRESLEKARWYIDRMIETRIDYSPEFVIPLEMLDEVLHKGGVIDREEIIRSCPDLHGRYVYGERPKDEA